MKGSGIESALNCLFTIIALPLGLWLLGYGTYLAAVGETDHGVFLVLLGVLVLGLLASGHLRARRQRITAPRGKPRRKG